jgi:lipopolysaccharide biosynthesis protein
VTYAPNGLISDATVYYLQQLLKKSIHVVLCVHVDNEELEFKENENLNLADAILVRKNIGFDFALWASALTVMPQLWQARQLIFTNDSILGPLATFDPLVQSLNNHEADFIALTDSHQLRYHAQSFFFALQHQALNNPVVRAFWSQVLSFQTKQEVINAYELNLWEIFSAHGQLKFDILFKTQDLIPSSKDPQFLNFNPTHQKWKELITEGFPFVKSELLQKNPTHMQIADWDQFIKPFCYDDQLVRLIQSHLDYLKATKLR